MHPSRHADAPTRRLGGREGGHRNASAPLLFSLPPGGTRARDGGWRGCNGSAFANTAAFQTDVCTHAHTHTHIHKAVNRRPIISHLFLTCSQSDRRLTIGHWGSGWASHLQWHTHAHTFVIFILASVSFHPATHFHLPLCFFFPSFLINWCCLRYYLCHTNQINGRHSFLKGKLLKKCVTEQICGYEEDLWSFASLLLFFFNVFFFCF